MKKLLTGITAILFSTMILTSCTKEGPAGPKGATGSAGAPGSTGPQGPQGPQGPAGNANVIGTTPITIGDIWVEQGTAPNNAWTVTLTATGVTQAIVDKGLVQGFVQYGSVSGTGNAWYPLPDIIGSNQTTFEFSLNKIILYNSNNDGTATLDPYLLFGSQTYRFVIISASNKAANPNVNWQDWNQVKEALHITD